MALQFFFELQSKNLTSKNALAQKVDFKICNVEIVKAVHWKVKGKRKKPLNDIFLSADLATNVIFTVIQMYILCI